YVYSGADGSLLFTKTGAAAGDGFGTAVAGVGDVNGDGKGDFLVGAPYSDTGGTDAGSAYLYSGANGSLLAQRNGAAAGDHFGAALAGAGDADGDGIPDLLVAAPAASPGGRSGAGSAYLYSGADGHLLFQRDGAAAQVALGTSVTGAGDVDGDGRADFALGS